MRLIVLIPALMFFLSAKAQTHLPLSSVDYMQGQPFGNSRQQWFLSKYAGVSAGFGFFNGGNASILSVPVGLQLNHPLNNNLLAFAGISAAPAVFNFNPYQDFIKSYPGSLPHTYNFGMNSRVEIGLMYINDAKTFSISGSIGVERGYYPVYPANRTNAKRQ